MTELTLLDAVAGSALPFVDLRWGDRHGMLRAALEHASRSDAELAIAIDAHEQALVDAVLADLPPGSRVVLSPAPPAELIARLQRGGAVVGVEVGSRAAASRAAGAGADFVVAVGCGAAGRCSDRTVLVLLQELLDGAEVPVVVRGGLGPLGAAAAYVAGSAGAILDSQLLLAPESGLPQRWRAELEHAGPFDTAVFGDLLGAPIRLLTLGRRDETEALRRRERELFLADMARDEARAVLDAAVSELAGAGFAGDTGMPPVGQGVAFARRFAEQGLGAAAIVARYREAISTAVASLRACFPFVEGSPLARRHGVRLPLVQGPMACVTDRPGLAAEVAANGALPFVATTALSPEASRALVAATREVVGEQFGVGVVLFANPDRMDEQIAAVLAESPRFVTVAGGDVAVGKRFQAAGVDVYLHAPSPDLVAALLDRGIRGLILEGHEAGGHVGELTSLTLWELAVDEILARPDGEIADLRVLFAGGLVTWRGALAAGAIAVPLAERGIEVGLQLGTAYLTTDEAVQAHCIPATYQHALISAGDTRVTGRTVNLPSRWLATEEVRAILAEEQTLLTDDRPLDQRKQAIERSNYARTMAVLAPRETPELPAVSDGAFSCGQAIAAVYRRGTIAGLHAALTARAAAAAADLAAPSEVGHDDLDDAIAIVGIGCVVPGADGPEAFWNNILERRSLIREVPPDRWDPELFYDPDRSAPDKSHSKIGAFVEGFEKNPAKFRIPPVSAPSIDRSQFLALEAAHQAFNDAGLLGGRLPRERTGVFIGNSIGAGILYDYGMRVYWPRVRSVLEDAPELQAMDAESRQALLEGSERRFKRDLAPITEDSCPGTLSSIVASRICHVFDLGGASFSMDAACASSLAAIQAAMDGLNQGRYDLALAGGIDTAVNAGEYVLFSKLDALSNRGSFPFDERADGFVMGEGAGLLVLKRWSDARRDGDRVYALIRGVGSSSDGRCGGITAPDPVGQARAMRAAYEHLPFGPETIDLVEAHGTGTPSGDKAEITSLTEVFAPHSRGPATIALGSVKSMIGHLKTAAGVAAVIKTALALHTKTLPPTLNCETPRRDVDWDGLPFFLNTEARPWDGHGAPRRAAVNAFGFGGLNYHLVLEEAPSGEDETATGPTLPLPARLVLLRAANRARIIDAARRLRTAVGAGLTLDQAARSSAPAGAAHDGPTLALVAGDTEQLARLLDRAVDLLERGTDDEITSLEGIYYGERPMPTDAKVAFLFPGQGAQYLGMGGDLRDCVPASRGVFAATDELCELFAGHTVASLLFPGEIDDEERHRREQLLVRTDFNHPALLALGATLTRLLRRAGVAPAMVAGHSLGEYTALHVAGVLDLAAAVALTTGRGHYLYEKSFGTGTMASVAAASDEVEPVLDAVPGHVTVANLNCPAQTVISGDRKAVEEACSRLAELGFPVTPLKVASAFHTELLAPSQGPFRELLDLVPVHQPLVPVQSNLTGRAYDSPADFPSYVRDTLAQQMVSPVNFVANVESLVAAGARLFIEVGPGATLCSFVDSILADRPHWTVTTNRQGRSATLELLHALAFCAARGLDVSDEALQPQPTPRGDRRRGGVRREAPLQRAAACVPPADPEPGLLHAALAGKPPAQVDRYIKRRRAFLEEMIRLDFEHLEPNDAAATAPAGHDALTRLVLEVVARRTGYPIDMIDLDMDAETELGLDSIKQVELVRELERELGLEIVKGARARHRVTTLSALIEELRGLTGGDITAPRPAAGRIADRDSDAAVGALPSPGAERLVCELLESPLATAHATDLAGKAVLVLADPDSAGTAVAEAIAAAGAKVALLAATDPPPAALAVDLVVDCWALGADERGELTSPESWWAATARQAENLHAVALAAVARDADDEPLLWVQVTSLGGDLGAGRVVRPAARAGIGMGLVRCLRSELPDQIATLHLDLDPEEPWATLARRVVDELADPPRNTEIGYPDGRRHLVAWRPAGRPTEPEAPVLADGDVVLAVGGARGITASLCRHLAPSARLRFVLVGSSPAPEPGDPSAVPPFEQTRAAVLAESGGALTPSAVEREAWRRVWRSERASTIAALRDAGCDVEYVQCDVADGDAVGSLVDRVTSRHGRIDLVLQGANTLLQRSTLDLDATDFAASARTKALGTANLIHALDTSAVELQAFVNLSSVVGRWGYPGLAGYAAAHEIAALLVAASRGRRPGRWINLIYGPWFGVGMTRLGAVTERLSGAGITFLDEHEGYALLASALASGQDLTVALAGAQDNQRPPVPSGGKHPAGSLLEDIRVLDDGSAAGRAVLDAGRDRFISEHGIAGEMVLPAVIALELIAGTAASLAPPGSRLVELADVELMRAVRFPRPGPRELHTRVRRAQVGDGEWFEGQLTTLFHGPVPGAEEVVVHATCRLRFGARRPAPAPLLTVTSSGFGDSAIDVAEVWRTTPNFGRGPLLHTIRVAEPIGGDGLRAEIAAPPLPELGPDAQLPNHIRLDAEMCLTDLWTLPRWLASAPFVAGIASLELYDGADQDAWCSCALRVVEDRPEAPVYDIEAVGAGGRVIERFRGVRKVAAPGGELHGWQPEPIWQTLRGDGRSEQLGALLGIPGRVEVANVRVGTVQAALEDDTERAYLLGQLSPAERDLLDRFAHSRRRVEWLAGRLAAKAAVRLLLGHDACRLADVEILSSSAGAPVVRLSAKNQPSPPRVSISHRADLAVAAAVDCGVPGVDVELLGDEIASIADTFTSAAESDALAQVAGLSRFHVLTMLWSAKEAARKALGPDTVAMADLRLAAAARVDEFLALTITTPQSTTVPTLARDWQQHVFALSAVAGRETAS